uniref:Large ribosomal subunit protein bL19c n=1 Tax=Calliarthron tuberculosum TaxID=48942 RepID=M4ITL8_CALTB|nr:50S ribosomal protein L19 [Calliarthron tuberculosum]AGA63800.1 50S ribosomal protein L19 [Calliarthron tuberculosum]
MIINKTDIIKNIENKYLKTDIPELEIGDTIQIGVLIQEGNKERIQFSEGVIIAIHKSNLNTTITLRRVFQGIGVEKVYLIHSPRITNMRILRKSKVRRAKLYYLRYKIGKATRLKQRFIK